MSLDGTGDGNNDDWSGLDLMGVVRRLAGQPEPQPPSALNPLLALFANAPNTSAERWKPAVWIPKAIP